MISIFRGSFSVTTQPNKGNESGGQYLGSKSDWFLFFNSTRKFDTTNSLINRLEVEINLVWVILGLIQLTYLINEPCSCSSCKLV